MASFKNLISNTSAQISSGGTITGDLIIDGDVQINGNGSLSFDEIIEGTQVIDVTSTEALLVRKNGDGGDVFTVNTTNSRVNVGTPTGTGIFEVEGSVDNDYAGRFENKHSGGYGALVKIAGTTANDLAFQVRADSTNILTINGDSSATFGGDVGIGASPLKNFSIADDNSFSNADGHISMSVSPSVSLNESAGIAFGTFNNDDYWKQGIFWKRTGSYGLGELHLCVRSTADTTTVSIADSALKFESNKNATFAGNIVVSSGVIQLADLAQSIDFIQSGAINYDSNNDQTGRVFSIGHNRSAGSSGGTTNFVLDENSRISLSNNDSGGTGGSDSTSANTILGWKAGHDISSGGIANSFVGHGAGNKNTTGDSNSGFGRYAGFGNYTGDGNTFVGSNAGLSDNASSHSNNTGVGFETLKAVTTGSYNVAVGARCGDALTDGEFNVFVGEFAGSTTTSVNNAVFIGQSAGGGADVSADGAIGIGLSALSALTSGASNTAVGYQTLKLETAGNYSTAIGYEALENQNGVSGTVANTALGYYAGNALTTGIKNTMLGAYAGYLSLLPDNCTLVGYNAGGSGVMTADADGTTAVGMNSLSNLTSGKKNVAVGKDTLKECTIGDSNIAIGYNAMFGDAGLQNDLNIAIGSESAAGSVLAAMGGQWTSNRCEQNIAIGTGSLAGNMNDSHDNTAVGYKSLNAVTTADDNVAIGSGAGEVTTTGGANTIVGYQALNGDVDGDGADNTALGHKALHDSVSPSKNVAIGDSAMRGLAGPANGVANCVAIGANAFYGSGDNTTINTNGTVAIGKDSLKALTTGANNTAIGYQALDACTTGTSNLAVGNGALGALTDAVANVAMGLGALGTNVSGNYNTAFGHQALQTFNSDVDGNNTAVGINALQASTTGTDNTVVGAFSGDAVTSQSNLTLVGKSAGGSINHNDANGTTAIGTSALTLLTNGRQNTAVGYGALETTANGDRNTAVGHLALGNVTGGNDGDNTAIGHNAGHDGTNDLTDGTENTLIGSSTRVSSASAVNQTVIGYNAVGAGDNSVVLGDSDVTDVYMAQDSGATVHCAGIQFPASQVANGGANVLDDYEEGTGSPTVSLTGSGSVTLGTSAGNAWTKVGNIVHFQFEFSITGVSSPVGALTVALPFTSAGTYYSAGSLRVHSETFDGSPFVAINPNATVAQLKCSKSGSSTTDITPTAGTRYFFGQITYRAA